MLYTKFPPQSFIGSGEEDFKCFLPYLPYMSMAAILFSSAKLFEQIISITSTEGPM